MGEMIIEDEMSPMETIQDEVYENNVGENYEF